MTTTRTALTWTAAAVLVATTSACAPFTREAAPDAVTPTAGSTRTRSPRPSGDKGVVAQDPARPADAAPTAGTRLPAQSADQTLHTATPTDTEPATPASSAPTSAVTPSPDRLMRVGDSGPDVVALQKQLLGKGFWLPEADGEYGAITQQAVFAAQKTYGLPRTGLAGPMTRQALAGTAKPTATSTTGRTIEIDIARQTFTLVENGKVKAVLNTSTGNGENFVSQGVRYVAVTPVGTYKIESRNPGGWVTGPLGDMYKPAFFNGGIAFHGSAEIPPYPASHGCARLSKSAQDYVWQQGFAEVGTTVVVR